MKKKFEPQVCAHCTQTLDYDLALDRGTTMIVLAFYNAIRRLNTTKIHIDNKMVRPASDFPSYRDMVEGGYITNKMRNNVSRARFHGLLASAGEHNSGEYVLTKKGANFLFRNEEVPRVAVIDKTTGHKAYYLDELTDRVTFSKLMKKEVPFWDFNDQTVMKMLGYLPEEEN